jgi:hypothetical protein
MKRQKLLPHQIWLLLFIERHCGLTGRMTLKHKHRERVVSLWRRDLVEIWWRHVADDTRPRGPYFSLTIEGHHLACSILAAREERRSKQAGARVQSQPPPALAA